MSDPEERDPELSPDVESLIDQAIEAHTAAPAPSAAADDVVSPLSANPAPVAAAPADDPRAAKIKQLESETLDSALAGAPGSSSTSSTTLANTAPAWYSTFLKEPPTPKNPLAGNLVQALLSQPRKDNYWHGGYLAGTHGNPSPDRENHDPGQAGRAMLGQAIGGAINRDPATEQYQRNLDAAQKQAQMIKTLRAGRTAGAANSVGLLNYFRNRGLDERKAQEAADYNSLSSPITQERRKAYVAAGIVSPEEADSMSAAALDKARVAFQNRSNQDFRATENDRRYARAENADMSKKERTELLKQAGESREQATKDAEGYIPGIAWRGGHPPAAPVVQEVRKIKTSRDRFQAAVDQQVSDQQKLQAAQRFALGSQLWNAVLGAPEEQRKMAERMRANYMEIQTGIRAAGEMGAPQEGEFRRVDVINPPPDSLKSWSAGQFIYPALKDAFGRSFDFAIRNRGGLLPGDPNDTAAPKTGVDIAAPVEFERVPVPPRRDAAAKSGARLEAERLKAEHDAAVQNALPVTGGAVPPIPTAPAAGPAGAAPKMLVLPSGARKPVDSLPPEVVQQALSTGKARIE